MFVRSILMDEFNDKMNQNHFRHNQRIRVIVGIIIMVTPATIHGFRIGSYLLK